MNEFIANETGDVRISEDVVVRIAAISAQKVDGVAALGATTSSWSEILSKKSQIKGVKVEFGEDSATVEIHLTVKYGVKIADAARAVQERVKNDLEAFTGIANVAVNVFVDAITLEEPSTPQDADAEDEEPGDAAAE